MVALAPPHQALALRLGATVRVLRKRKGWKQEALAQAAGYGSRSAIASIEAGWVLPSLEKMLDLAAALSVRPSALLDDETAPLAPPLPPLSPAERRAMLRCLRRLVADLEEVEPPA